MMRCGPSSLLKTQRQLSDFFGIWRVPLVEVTVVNLRLPFLKIAF